MSLSICLDWKNQYNQFKEKHDMHLDLLLNLMAQGVIPLQQAGKWFDSLPDDEQEAAISKLIQFIYQAKVSAQDIPVFLPSAICFAGLKPSHTPVQMLKACPVLN